MIELEKQLSQLNSTSKKSVALYHKAALAIGVSDSALGVLYALLEAEELCSQYDLCSDLSLPKQTINTTVAVLQKKGFVSLAHIPGTRNKKKAAQPWALRAAPLFPVIYCLVSRGSLSHFRRAA